MKLKIVGQGAPASLLSRVRPGVEVLGMVPDLRPHLAGAAVLIAPLLVGGGTRLKILEGMEAFYRSLGAGARATG